MSRCTGRCECHAADWAALDKAAGIKNHKSGRGRTRINPDPASFRRLLSQHYFAEWDTAQRDPEHRPTMTAVAENRFGYSERTLRRNMQRYSAEWPPGSEPDWVTWPGLTRDASGFAQTWTWIPVTRDWVTSAA